MLFNVYQKKKFLIVDDFDNFIFSVRQMLKGLGVTEIDSARNGVAAVDLCIKKHYDVVLCDYNLGADKNGQQVLEELRHRKLLKNTDTFVIVSAEAAKDMVYGALEFQPDAYITKPVTQAILQNRLDLLVQQKEAVKDVNRALDEQDYAKAITHCQRHLLKKSPYQGWVIRTLANLFFMSGDFQSAQKIYDDVIANRPLDWARLGKGRVQLREGKYEEAKSTLSDLVSDRPELMEAYDLLAETQQKLGQAQKAQETLEEAVSISPRALSRQRHLAAVSMANYDLETASKAYRSSTKLSENSCQEAPEIYLDHARCLSSLAEADRSREGRKLADEAIRAADKVRRKYKADADVQAMSHMVEARILVGQEKTKEAEKALKKAEQYFADIEQPNAELALEMAETYYANGQQENASDLLGKLADANTKNSSVLHRIDELRDEPVTLKQRIKARELNRRGIDHYEQGALSEALAIFGEALAITPQHVGLNLNLLQSVVKGNDAMLLQQPELNQALKTCFQRLSHLSSNHRQYKRYRHLLERYQKLYPARRQAQQ